MYNRPFHQNCTTSYNTKGHKHVADVLKDRADICGPIALNAVRAGCLRQFVEGVGLRDHFACAFAFEGSPGELHYASCEYRIRRRDKWVSNCRNKPSFSTHEWNCRVNRQPNVQKPPKCS